MAGYRDLIASQKAMALAERVYRVTDSFPKQEQFGLTSQVRRAAVSIASNIAEGYGRLGKVEFARFLRIALGSAREVETQIILAGRLKFADRDALAEILHSTEEVAKIIRGLLKAK
jgi:four helix bundle protein